MNSVYEAFEEKKVRGWKRTSVDGFPEPMTEVHMLIESDTMYEDDMYPMLVRGHLEKVIPNENFGQSLRWMFYDFDRNATIAVGQSETVVLWRYTI